MSAPGEASSAALHRFSLEVYWEDTDAAGIVYYANYLRFIERARSDLVRQAGIDQNELRTEFGLFFAVKRCDIDYRAPARLGDRLSVATRIDKVGGASVEMTQDVERAGEILVSSRVRLACMTSEGRLSRIPADCRAALARARGGNGV